MMAGTDEPKLEELVPRFRHDVSEFWSWWRPTEADSNRLLNALKVGRGAMLMSVVVYLVLCLSNGVLEAQPNYVHDLYEDEALFDLLAAITAVRWSVNSLLPSQKKA
jgi:hypothetical protein